MHAIRIRTYAALIVWILGLLLASVAGTACAPMDGDNFEQDEADSASDENIAATRAKAAAEFSSPYSWIEVASQNGSLLGSDVAGVGDVNGDDYDDVLIGQAGYSNGQEDEGAAYLYLGSMTGLPAVEAWSVEGNLAAAALGWAVAGAGDTNDDTYADIVIGAPGYSGEGGAFVFLGSPTGPAGFPEWSYNHPQTDADFGFAVDGGGSVNNDDYADIVVGAPGYHHTSKTNEGAAYLFLGSGDGPGDDPAWSVQFDQSEAFFGRSVAIVGDVNDDGYDDVVVGAPGYETNINDDLNKGLVSLYLGSATGPSTTASWSDVGPAFSQLGWSVAAAGDVNDDGYDDFVAGAPGYTNGHGEEGAVFLYLGGDPTPAADPDWTYEADQDGAVLGTDVAGLGDVNGDEYDDFAVGAPLFKVTADKVGRIFVFYGSADGPADDPDFTAKGTDADGEFGKRVAAGWDINHDDASDLLVGAPAHEGKGAAFAYYGIPTTTTTTTTTTSTTTTTVATSTTTTTAGTSTTSTTGGSTTTTSTVTTSTTTTTDAGTTTTTSSSTTTTTETSTTTTTGDVTTTTDPGTTTTTVEGTTTTTTTVPGDDDDDDTVDDDEATDDDAVDDDDDVSIPPSSDEGDDDDSAPRRTGDDDDDDSGCGC
ncbi:FG-GAP repeat protein [bacterium]|nr:FG-GAP repeat protein [bacterium]